MSAGGFTFDMYQDWVDIHLKPYNPPKNIMAGIVKEGSIDKNIKLVMFLYEQRAKVVLEAETLLVKLIDRELVEKFAGNDIFIEEIDEFSPAKRTPIDAQSFQNPFLRKDNFKDLNVFLCHAKDDKSQVSNLYSRLRDKGFTPWFDEESLLPGQDWDLVIQRQIKQSDVVIVCLSSRAVSKRGYVQKEIKQALKVADEQPEGMIFIIPVRFDDCIVPDSLSRWHWVNLFDENGFDKLTLSLDFIGNKRW